VIAMARSPLTLKEVERRKPVWQALSNMYLDTDNTEEEFQRIAKVIMSAGYSIDEADIINRQEVFPLVGTNLLSVAGDWAWDSYDQELIAHAVVSLRRKSTWFGRLIARVFHWCFRWMYAKDWVGVCQAYHDLSVR
jgi:hypothetical protein